MKNSNTTEKRDYSKSGWATIGVPIIASLLSTAAIIVTAIYRINVVTNMSNSITNSITDSFKNSQHQEIVTLTQEMVMLLLKMVTPTNLFS